MSIGGFGVGLFLVMGSLQASHAQSSPAPQAQSNVPVLTFHVSRCEAVLEIHAGYVQHLEGTLDGRKVIMESDAMVTGALSANQVPILPPGDYQVQLVEEKQMDAGVVRKYMLTFANGKQRKYQLIGLSE